MEKDLKRTGYIILFAGIILILIGLIQGGLVLTGYLKPAGLFNFSSSDFAIDGEVLFPQLPNSLTNGLKVELFPASLINSVLNLGANTSLVLLFIFAGGKIATVGTQMLRPIYIKQKNE